MFVKSLFLKCKEYFIALSLILCSASRSWGSPAQLFDPSKAVKMTADTSAFITGAQTAIGVFRVIGIMVVCGGLIWAAIEWMNGDGHSSKGLLVKTAVAAVIVLIAPAIITYFIGWLG